MRWNHVLLVLILAACPACELLYLPPTTWFVFPIAEFSDNSLDVPDYDDLVQGAQAELKQLSVAVLRNPNRGRWTSVVDGEVLDERPDENALLAEFIEDQEIFGQVVLIDSLSQAEQDFILSVSVDCIYQIELDGGIYVWNCITLGLGTFLGWPHHDSSAFYVAEGVIYDNRGERPQLVTGSLVENYKEWYCDNIYWRPDFYDLDELEPLFEQILYDFLTRSGCLSG
jgi:hypothetical protein